VSARENSGRGLSVEKTNVNQKDSMTLI